MEVMVSVAVMKKKLTARIAELKKRRSKSNVVFEKAFKAWKSELTDWIRGNVALRVATITMGSVEHGFGQRHWNNVMLSGAPKPPTRRDWERDIREATRQLKLLELTHTKTMICVSESIVSIFLDKKPEEDTED